MGAKLGYIRDQRRPARCWETGTEMTLGRGGRGQIVNNLGVSLEDNEAAQQDSSSGMACQVCIKNIILATLNGEQL